MSTYLFLINILISIFSVNSFEETLCPSVFAVPTDPFDKRIQWINGTGCAIKCKSPVWTEREWDIEFTIGNTAMYIGLPMDLIVIITWLFNKQKRKQYFVLSFALYSFILQMSLFPLSFFSFEDIFCNSSVVSINSEDGLNYCNVQSFLSLLGLTGSGLSWMLGAIDLHRNVVLGKKTTPKRGLFNLSLIFILSLIPVLVMGITKSYGYLSGSTMCFVGGPYLTFVVYLPFFIYCVAGGVPVISVIIVIIRHNKRIHSKTGTRVSIPHHTLQNSTAVETFKMVKRSGLFILAFYLLIFPVTIYRFYAYVAIHNGATLVLANMNPWIDCIFKHFDGTDDTTWKNVCGEYPPERVPFFLSLFHAVSAHGTALLVSSTYLFQKSVWKIWSHWLNCETNKANIFSGSSVGIHSSGANYLLNRLHSHKIFTNQPKYKVNRENNIISNISTNTNLFNTNPKYSNNITYIRKSDVHIVSVKESKCQSY